MKSLLKSALHRKTAPFSIEISGGNNYLTRSYTTNDTISGNIKLAFEEDTLLDDLSITFKGSSYAKVTNLQPWSHSSAAPQRAHNFLYARQPIETSQLPESNIARGKTVYTLPFAFVVPDQLLDYACSHEIANDSVRQAHILLPPSMGKPEGCNTQVNDLTPETVMIIYSIGCCAKIRTSARGSPKTIQQELPVHITPTRREEPPLHITEYSQYHKPRVELDIYEGLRGFSKHTGRLIAETQQPLPLRMPYPHQVDAEAAITTATIRFRFEPSSCEDLPPRIGTVKSKLHIYTYSGIKPFSVIPDPCTFEEYSTIHRLHSDSMDLLSHDLDHVEWTPHDTDPRTTDTVRSNDEEKTASLFYTSSLQIPITFGQQLSCAKKICVPSFNSCLVCRNYALEIKISRGPQQRSSISSMKSYDDIVGGSSSTTNKSEASSSRRSSIASSMLDTSMALKVPIQIMAGLDSTSHEVTEGVSTQSQQSFADVLHALDELSVSGPPANDQSTNTGDLPPEYQPTSNYR